MWVDTTLFWLLLRSLLHKSRTAAGAGHAPSTVQRSVYSYTSVTPIRVLPTFRTCPLGNVQSSPLLRHHPRSAILVTSRAQPRGQPHGSFPARSTPFRLFPNSVRFVRSLKSRFTAFFSWHHVPQFGCPSATSAHSNVTL